MNCAQPTAPPTTKKAELDTSRKRQQCVTERQDHSMFREGLNKTTKLGTPDWRNKTNFLPSAVYVDVWRQKGIYVVDLCCSLPVTKVIKLMG